jgi:DNA-binding HxlR family transcriptional regulator
MSDDPQDGTQTYPTYSGVPTPPDSLVSVGFDLFNPACPSRRALDLIGDKWTPLVVWSLRDGTKRYNELRRSIPAISQRMMTRSLRKLEEDGLVDRRVHDTNPPKVDYTLTTKGETLLEPLRAILAWAEAYFTEPPGR